MFKLGREKSDMNCFIKQQGQIDPFNPKPIETDVDYKY